MHIQISLYVDKLPLKRCPQTNTGLLQEGGTGRKASYYTHFGKLLNIQPGECIICAENKYH